MARPFQFDKDVVLEKAMFLFWDKGYFNTSFQDIVEHLELSRSSIYNSFTDKRVLFIESLKFYISKESKSLIENLSKLPPTQESVRTILQHIVQVSLSKKKPKGCLVVNTATEFAQSDEEIKQIIEKNVREVVSAFTDYIIEGQKQGNFTTKVKAEALAIAWFHQITALRVTTKILTDRSFFDATINTFIQLFIKS